MTDVTIRVLGAVAVERDGVPETRRSRNHGAILGMLALHAGEAVDGDLLIDEAWGEDLPKNPRGRRAVHTATLGSATLRPMFATTMSPERAAVDTLARALPADGLGDLAGGDGLLEV